MLFRSGRIFTAYDALGNDVTAAVAPAVTIGLVADMRQSDSAAVPIPTVDVDMQALAATGHFPANGLLYAAHEAMGDGTTHIIATSADQASFAKIADAVKASVLAELSEAGVDAEAAYQMVVDEMAKVMAE